MKKIFSTLLLLIVLLLGSGTKCSAQTTLSAGDIAFIGLYAGGSGGVGDAFTFITLKDLSAGTVIYFTDDGWNDGVWGGAPSEVHFTWSPPAGGTPIGTIVTITGGADQNVPGTPSSGTCSATFLAGTTWHYPTGEEILAYQSSTGVRPASPTFIAGIMTYYNTGIYDATTKWCSTTTGFTELASTLPRDLANGTNCVSVANASYPASTRNCRYNGSLTGTSSQVRALINSDANWTRDATTSFDITSTIFAVPNITGLVSPTVTTQAVSSITAITATGNGNITNLGAPNPTAYGVCWNTTGTPTISDSKADNGAASATGAFTASMTGLTAGTTYYLRAYATNTAGTSYGTEVSFTTTPVGTGTLGAPYLISNLAELRWIADQVNSGTAFSGKYFKQTANIDATETSGWNSGAGWIPIGYDTDGSFSTYFYFSGNYDGQNYIISNLYMNRSPFFCGGLFGMTFGATISNVGLSNVALTASTGASANQWLGALIGYAYQSTVINNCYATGNISGDINAGGLIGSLDGSGGDNSLSNSYFNGTVSAHINGAGGLCADVSSGNSISKCYSAGSVTGPIYTGGFIGNCGGTVNNCYSTSTVSGGQHSGGLIGAGYNTTTLNNCYATGAVSGTSGVGGLIGYNFTAPTITNCFWDTQSSGQLNSAGGGTGKTSSEMHTSSTFTEAGWDFIINWNRMDTKNNKYPYLVWQVLPSTATVTTTAAASIASSSATLGGDVTANGGANVTERGIVYSTTDATPEIGEIGVTKDANGSGIGVFSETVSGLSASTLYYVNSFATNSAGTSYGIATSFTTLAIAPTVITNAATSITATSATINGSINANNASTVVTFEYGLTTDYGTTVTADQSPVTGNSATAVSKAITGLTPNTIYHYRVIGVNAGGTINGNDMSFTSLGIAPTVSTQAVSCISTTTATGNGNITNLGVPNPTAYGVCWNTGGSPTISDSKVDNGAVSATGAFTASMTGLIANTTYYVRAYATNTAGTSYGTEVIFTSSPFIGDGTQAVPYQIATLAELRWLSEHSSLWSSHFIQTANIDASTTSTWNAGRGFSPIGNNGTKFTGNYNGQYHTITGLTINRPTSDDWNIGFFGSTSYATIKNIGLVNCSVRGYQNVGAMVGYNDYSPISNCFCIGTVSGSNVIGGLTGSNRVSNIANCYSAVSVTGSSDVGGLIGYDIVSTFTNSFYDSDVSGRNDVGKGTPKTTTLMKLQSTFTGWDFVGETANGSAEIWAISSSVNNGYPCFMNQITSPLASTVTTQAVSSITTSSATGNGNITSLGVPNPSQYGMVWSINTNPTVALITKTAQGPASVTGAYTSSITGLAANTNYYVRAYATNSVGSSYGDQVSFWTLANIPSAPTLNNPTLNTLAVTVNVNNNPVGTEFAIQEIGGNYVQADGSLNTDPVWQNAATWGTKTVIGLTIGTSYTFQVKARNGINTETVLGSTAQLATLSPEINIKQDQTNIADGGTYNFGNGLINTNTDIVFTVENTDEGTLTLTTPISIGGVNANQFSIQAQPVSPVAGAGSTTFTLRFTPTSIGAKTATISIANNDSDENPYDITIQGTGINTPTEQASDIQFSNITRTGMTVRWTRGDGEGSILLAKEQYRIATTPLTDGVVYENPNTNYTSAPSVGGAKLLYNGTAVNPSINVSGLTKYKLYYFKAFAYNNASNPYYLQTDGINNPASRWTLRRDGMLEEDLTIDAEYAYPNPASYSISTTLDMFEAGTVSAKLYDAAGRIATELYNQSLSFGTHELKFDISTVPSGVYQLIISKGSEAIIYPVSVVK